MSRDEIHKRVLARLLESHDPAKARHKPLALLLPELRRQLDQLIEQEAGPFFAQNDREKFIEEILVDVPGTGPLEDIFNDETVTEFLVLNHDKIIRRDGDGWLPVTAQFHDRKHYRQTLRKIFAESEQIGEPVRTGDGAFDGRLPNGFRVIAIVPPSVLEQPALVLFRRERHPVAAPVHTPPPRSVVFGPMESGAISAQLSGRAIDPWERIKQRVTSRFIQRLAANGIYDISAVPTPELKRVVGSQVAEFNDSEKFNLDAAAQERLTLEILAGMQR
jgi:hypothetical protein